MTRSITAGRIRTAFVVTTLAALLTVGIGLVLATTTPGAEAQSAPGAVTNLTLTRADGTVTANWDAPAGATKYHVTYSSDNRQSWNLAALEHTTNSITFNADNSKTYVVGARAGNDNGQWSGWVNSTPAGPYTPQPPAAPASVTLTRADGTVTASWDAVNGATKYHVTYSTNNKQSWSAPPCGANCGNNVTITGADNSQDLRRSARAPATPPAGAAGATPHRPAPSCRTAETTTRTTTA